MTTPLANPVSMQMEHGRLGSAQAGALGEKAGPPPSRGPSAPGVHPPRLGPPPPGGQGAGDGEGEDSVSLSKTRHRPLISCFWGLSVVTILGTI